MADEGTTTITQDEDIQANVNSFVQAIIVEYQSRHRVTVLSHALEPKSTAEVGLHFTCNVFRLAMAFEMRGEKYCSSVILKVPHLSPGYSELKNQGLYERETYTYETILSRIHKFWPGDSFSPLFYGASPSGLLALENLQECGFRMLPKSALMDLTECKLVLGRLAQFHAASVKYLKQYKVEDVGMFTSTQLNDDIFLPSTVHKMKTYVIPTLTSTELNKWMDYEKNFHSVYEDSYLSPATTGFTVLLHGDLQANNLLMKDGRECKFIDFQFCRPGSPILDLIYFLIISVKWDVMEQHREVVFNHYLDALKEVLEELDCSDMSYNRDEFDADFEKYKLYVIYVLSAVVPVLRSGVRSFKGSNEGQNELHNLIQSADYISLFKNWLELI